MKILFLGNQVVGVAALEEIVATGKHELLVVSPPANRLRDWQQSVSDWARERRLPVATPHDINSAEFYAMACDFEPDIILSVFYNQVLGPRLLALPRLGGLNLHPALLPKYRGSGVLLWALMNGEQQIGITIHFMIEKVDAGDIVLQRSLQIDPSDTGYNLYLRIADLTRAAFREEFLAYLESGQFPRRPMPFLTKPYTSKEPRRNNLAWTMSSSEITNIVRALTFPLDGAYTEFQSERLYIWRALNADGGPAVNGQTGQFSIDESRARLFVRTGSGAIEILDVSYRGSRLSAEDFIRQFWREPEGRDQ